MRGKKLRDNGLFESSRMIPQHKEAINQHRRNARKRARPEYDEQRYEELQVAISDAVESRQTVAVTAWGVYEDETHVGVVVDVRDGRMKLSGEHETVWVPLPDVVDIKRP